MNELEAKARADIRRVLRGTRWQLDEFTVSDAGALMVGLHDETNGMWLVFKLAEGGPWTDLLRAIGDAVKRTHEQVLEDERQQHELYAELEETKHGLH